VGVSRDSVESHARFKSQYGLPFSLIADPDGALFSAVGSNRRSTYLFDGMGRLAKSWPNVNVEGHPAEVLASIE
jgi:peroxiredoxin Q/BCP